MEGEIIFGTDSAHKVVTVEGARLVIVATRIVEKEWSLRVENERGVSTNWCDFFSSAELAIQRAEDAIKEEGVADFVDVEGFEYLDELLSNNGQLP